MVHFSTKVGYEHLHKEREQVILEFKVKMTLHKRK